MKKIILFISLLLLFSFHKGYSQKPTDKETIQSLKDSIEILNRSIKPMNLEQLNINWQYFQIKKYYSICVKNPKNKKFFYGWVSRAFNNKITK